MNKSNTGANSDTTYVIIDVFTILLGFLLTTLRFWDDLSVDNTREFTILAFVFLIIFLLNNKKEYIYNVTMFFYLDRIYRKITKSFLTGAGITIAIIYFTSSVELDSNVFLFFIIITYILVCCNTLLFRNRFVRIISKRILPRTAFVGKKESLNKFLYFFNKTSICIKNMGYICMNDEDCSDEYLGSISNLESIIREHNLDQIYIIQKREHDLDVIQKYIDMCIEMGVTCRVIVDYYKRRKASSYVSSIGTYPVITYHTISLNSYERIIKRLTDIISGFIGIVMSSPIMLITAIAIKLDSPGPVFFKQTRVGQNGRLFKIYKFRSMYIDAEERKKELMAQNEIEGGIMFKMKDDPRITRVGKIIRKLSVDELPQFFNVFGGSMSLVGTRPPTVDEVEKYERNQWRRISIKPGLTGMWQVNGRSNVSSFEDIVRMDTEYIDNWNLWLDLKIILKTVAVVLKHEGSY
ncbi:MAG: sugar transferase [Lachnospiraceae bacterium]|nr:sugar transferase [Lachnospiraceae bacterium]